MRQYIRLRGERVDISKKTWIMGILNVTPDSFSDGGKYDSIDRAIMQAKDMIASGVDIIDIGGESTRPGYTPVSTEEEIARVVPVVQAIRQISDVYLSIDTFKSETAKAALAAGADMINDIWGLKYDAKIAEVCKQYDCPLIIMHNRTNPEYKELIADVKRDLIESINIAKAHGLSDEHIIVDPGIGFQKTKSENLHVLKGMAFLKDLGYPILLGTSRKSVIHYATNRPVNERDEATAATTAYGIMHGADFVRVHNVDMTKRIIEMMDVLVGKGEVVNG